jgi:hypothetical protein
VSKKYYLPLGKFAPDGADFDTSALKRAKNLLPLFGGHRPWRRRNILSSEATGTPITGTHGHLVLLEEQLQKWRPNGDQSVIGWFSVIDPDNDDLFAQVDDISPSDARYVVYGREDSNPGALISALEDLTDPGSPLTGRELLVRYKVVGAVGAWTLDFNLCEGTGGSPTVISTGAPTESGSVDQEWKTASYVLTTGEAGSVTDHDDLCVKIDVATGGSVQALRPASDLVVGQWLNEGGAAINLYQSIDETVGSDSDYAVSPVLAPGGASHTYRCGLGAGVDPVAHEDHTVRYKRRETNDGCSLVVRLREGTKVIKAVTDSSLSTTALDEGFTLTVADMAKIDDYGALSLEFIASYPTAATSTVTSVGLPDATLSDNDWVPSSGATLHEAIDADDAVYIEEDKAGDQVFVVGIADKVDPQVHDGHVLHVKAARTAATGTPNRFVTVELLQFSTVIASFSTTGLSTTPTDYSYVLTAAQAALILNYGELSLRVVSNGTTSTSKVRVYYAHFDTPEPRRVEVSWAELEVPSATQVWVSWVQLQTPQPNTSFVGDSVEIYAGSEQQLWQVSEAGFSDVSIAAGYGKGGDSPRSWSIVSYGGDVVASNYVDPVQIKAAGTALFANLITSPSPAPSFRHLAVVNRFLVGANVNYSGSPAGQSNELWWSALGDPANFTAPSPATQSDRRLLTQTPGQITGIVGGEFGVIFKAGSILRMNYVGTPLIFQIDVLATDVGCPWPRSIVPYGDFIYFRSSGSFARLDGRTGEIVFLGEAELVKSLVDSDFEDAALGLPSGPDERIYDAMVVGARDAFSRLVFWGYVDTEAAAHRASRAVAYNPHEERFGEYEEAGLDLAALVTWPNVTNTSQSSLLRGVAGLSWDGSSSHFFRWDSQETIEGEILTQTISAKSILGQKSSGRSVILTGVRPVYKEQRKGTQLVPASFTLTVTGSDDSQMRVNVESRETTSEQATPELVYPIDPPLEFEYATFQLAIASMTGATLKHVYALELFYQEGGDYA